MGEASEKAGVPSLHPEQWPAFCHPCHMCYVMHPTVLGTKGNRNRTRDYDQSKEDSNPSKRFLILNVFKSQDLESKIF